jgi:hypothetical protein
MILPIIIMIHDLRKIVQRVLESLLHVFKASAFLRFDENFGDPEAV